MYEKKCIFAQIFTIMGFFSIMIDSIKQIKQEDLLNKARYEYLSFEEKVKLVYKLDREHLKELYKIWYKDSDGLRAIVASQNYYYEFSRNIMLRTDVPVDVSKTIIDGFTYNDVEEIVLHRFFRETNSELFDVLKRCLYLHHIEFPRDKNKELVQSCLNKYVEWFTNEHTSLVNDMHITKCSRPLFYGRKSFSIHSFRIPIEKAFGVPTQIDTLSPKNQNNTDERKKLFKERFENYIKEYAFKEISSSELRQKLENSGYFY